MLQPRFVVCAILLFLSSTSLFAAILLDQLMSREEQRATGVAYLAPIQKKELENWIDKNFILKTSPPGTEVTLMLNIGRGKVLQLSDKTYYEVAPDDVVYSSAWIGPATIQKGASQDPNYPVLLMNLTTKTKIRAKQIPSLEFQDSASTTPVMPPAPPNNKPPAGPTR